MKHERLLKSIMGADVYEALTKALYKPETQSVIDLTELHDSLKTVPKAIMAFLLSHLKEMKKDETKEISIPWSDNCKMIITKQTNDVYKGKVIKDSKEIHNFDLTPIPQLGVHLMSVTEEYSDPSEESSKEESTQDESSKHDQIENGRHDILQAQMKVLESKIDQIMLHIANKKDEKIAKTELKKKIRSFNEVLMHLKKTGLAPKMPSPPSPGKNVGGMAGMTRAGIHGAKTAATDTNKHPVTAVKNPDLKAPKLPAQPKQPKMPTLKSEKTLVFNKSEMNGSCQDCGLNLTKCKCFAALSKPEIKKSEGNKVKVTLKSDWDVDSISALYRTIKRS